MNHPRKALECKRSHVWLLVVDLTQHAGVCSIQTFWYIIKSSFYEPIFPCFAHRAEVLELKINPKEPVTTLSKWKSFLSCVTYIPSALPVSVVMIFSSRES